MKWLIIPLLLAAGVSFVYFHAPNGDLVAILPSDGQIIVRAAPPGYAGKTMIQTGVGNALVVEPPCEVAHKLEQKCPKKND